MTKCCLSSSYRGPCVILGLGAGFLFVGAVPVTITFSIGVRTSATIIGIGFIGFGFLLMLPGLFWCLSVRIHSFNRWRRRRSTASAGVATAGDKSRLDSEMSIYEQNQRDTDILRDINVNNNRSSRTRSWPSTYNPPSIIVADNEVCRAATPLPVKNGLVNHVTADDADSSVIDDVSTCGGVGVEDNQSQSSCMTDAACSNSRADLVGASRSSERSERTEEFLTVRDEKRNTSVPP